MFVLDVDDEPTLLEQELPWTFSHLNADPIGGLFLGGAITVAVRYAVDESGRIGFRGIHTGLPGSSLSLTGGFLLGGAISVSHRHTLALSGGPRIGGNTSDVGRFTVALVGRLGFNAQNFGAQGGSPFTPVFILSPDQFIGDDDDDDGGVLELEIPLIVVDTGSLGLGVTVTGGLKFGGAMSASVRYGVAEVGRLGFRGAESNALHHTIALVGGGLKLGGATQIIVPGSLAGGLRLGGAISAAVRYGLDLSGGLRISGLTDNAQRSTIDLSGRLSLAGLTSDAVEYDLTLVGYLGLNGRLVLSTGAPLPFNPEGLILTDDGTAYVLTRRRRR